MIPSFSIGGITIFKKLFILTALWTGAAQAATQATDISNVSVINLSIEQSSLSLTIPYPGHMISGLCGIEIRSDSPGRAASIANLLADLEINKDFGVDPVITVKNDKTILLDFSAAAGGYGTWFSIKTKDGSTLKQKIKQKLGPQRTVILIGVTCP